MRHVLPILFFLFLPSALGEGPQGGAGQHPPEEFFTENMSQDEQIEISPLSPDIFPCSDCHSTLKEDRRRRVIMDVHSDKARLLQEQSKHSRHLWCYSCHNTHDKDHLKLADGTDVKFTESYKLCGQCHSGKLNDWKMGIHGRRTGSWSGKKSYYLCVHCHDAHSPNFKPMAPEPPPLPPSKITFNPTESSGSKRNTEK